MMKTFNKPDRNAPRFRPKKVTVLNNSLFERFKTRYPEYVDIDLATFRNIVKTFNGKLADGITDTRDGIELPEGLGFIFMGTCPATKKQNIDIVKSLEHGVVVNHKNWESDNMLMKIFYTNHASKYPLQNKQVWAFKAVRQFRKKASDAYKENWPKYIVVDNTKKISALFAGIRKRDFIKENSKVIPEGYNEFNM